MSTATAQRTAKRWQLGRAIAYLRERKRLKQADLSKVIDNKQQSKIAALEDGKATIKEHELLALADLLGATEEERAILLDLRTDSGKKGFWSTGYGRAYPYEFRFMADLERHADTLRTVEAEVVPGMLQCDSYVRALFAHLAGGPAYDDHVEARLSRGRLLSEAGAPTLHVVVSESALRREYGDPGVMREQMEYLINISRWENIRLQALPFRRRGGRQISIRSMFTLVHLPQSGIGGPLEIAFSEGEGDIRYLDDEKALQEHHSSFGRFTAAALDFEPTREFLREVANDFASM
jgi:transcriptional regulator with XRE-family HTH domain